MDVRSLLPQQGHMVFIDRIERHDADSIECTMTATPARCALFDGNGIPGWVGLECMAQASAVLLSVGNHEDNVVPLPGMVVGAREARTTVASLPLGQEYLVRVQREASNAGVSIFRGEMTNSESGAIVAEASFSVMTGNA